MAQAPAPESSERLTLHSELAELSRVPSWVEALAARYSIPGKTVFIIDLCLEEALSNIIRHGYKGEPDKAIVILFHRDKDQLAFTIEDEAPHFCPPDTSVPEAVPLEELTPGGLGIPLMRRFADCVDWEPLEKGNRLTLGFSLTPQPLP